MRKKRILALVLVLGAIGLTLAWRSLGEPFTTEKWENASPQMRDRLLAEIANSEMLVGLSENEVYSLLGQPDGAKHGHAVYYFSTGVHSGPCIIFEFTREGHVESQSLSSMGGTTSNAKFEAEAWRSGSPSDRLSMARDLRASHWLEGMHRDDLYALLGNPDREASTDSKVWYTRRYYDENGEIKKRYAGMSKCLYIHFRDGKVDKAEFTGS